MLKIALIGYGYWGSKLARNFQNLETFKLISIADIKSKNLSLAKKNYPLAKTSNDYKSIIKNNIIDLVIISSPTTTHYKICKFALENYKHVLVEKPLSLSLKEVKKLTKIPIVAIGGINNKNYKKLLLSQADFLAISGYIWKNKKFKPEHAIKKIKL